MSAPVTSVKVYRGHGLVEEVPCDGMEVVGGCLVLGAAGRRTAAYAEGSWVKAEALFGEPAQG